MKSDSRNAQGALLDSFAELARNRRYQDFGVGMIVEKARVARSTFYYYFKEKDDLLLQNLKPMISVLAGLPTSSAPPQDLGYWLAHIWEHRGNARRIFEGPTGRKIANTLTEELQFSLRARSADRQGNDLTPLLAAQIAGSILSLLQAWVCGRGTASPSEIAGMIWTSTVAMSG